MTRWVQLKGAESLKSGQAKRFSIEKKKLAVAREGDSWYVFEDACPHQGASLAGGLVLQGLIICPLHSWAFDLKTGACRGMPSEGLSCYPVRVSQSKIEVGFPAQGELPLG